MVQIYTKTGDNGTTGLLNGKRYKKDELVFDVLGTLDELSSVLGYLHLSRKKKLISLVVSFQSDLLEIGSFVSCKEITAADIAKFEDKIKYLESQIDEFDAKNIPLHNFILTGGSEISIHLHHARAVCRRAERLMVALNITVSKDKFAVFVRYLNRLSDFLFVLARYYNNKGKSDVIWFLP